MMCLCKAKENSILLTMSANDCTGIPSTYTEQKENNNMQEI